MKRGRIVRIVVAGIAVIAIAGIFGFSWFVSGQLIHSPTAERIDHCAKGTPLCEPEVLSELGLDPARFEFSSFDGTRLSGLHLPSRNGATVLVLHGYRANRASVMDLAKMFHEAGFGVLTVDMRGHGESGGDWITLGRDDVRDLRAVLDYAVDRLGVDPARIGVVGISLGGGTAIMLAAGDERLRAVVADSPFDEIDAETVGAFTDLPRPIPWLVATLIGMRLQTDFHQIAPLTVVDIISPRPLYVLYAGSDTVVAQGSGERLYAAAGEPKQIWREPEFYHGEFWLEHKEDYERNVLPFLTKYLTAVE